MNKPLSSPRLLWPYAGSKATIADWHVSLFPERERYVSVFCGTCAELMVKPVEPLEIVNDLDDDIVNVFRVIRNRRKCDELKDLLLCTPHSRTEFNLAKERLDDSDPLVRAWAFLTVSNLGRCQPAVKDRNILISSKLRLARLPETLDFWRLRMRYANLECRPWRTIIDTWDKKADTFFYCDPPYHPSTFTIKASRFYRYMMSPHEHIDLLLRLKQIKGKVMLCGYPSQSYSLLLSEPQWTQIPCPLSTLRHTGNHAPTQETVWVNYEPPAGCDMRKQIPKHRGRVRGVVKHKAK